VVATLIKSSLAHLNISLSTQSLAWPTQWARGKSAGKAQHQDIFMEYWWPDYPDPYSWFVNLLQTQKQPYFNLSYFSDPALDHQINQVETLMATSTPAGSALYRDMQVEVLHTAPVVALYGASYQYAMRGNFTGFSSDPAYPNVIFVYDLRPRAG